MTAFHTGWAWRRYNLPTTPKYVLLALADQADDDGVVDVSVSALRKRTGLAQDAVRYALDYLGERGLVSQIKPEHSAVDQPCRLRILADTPPVHAK